MSDDLKTNYTKLNKRYQEIKNQLADLEAKLAESEKSKESYRLQNEHHHLQLLQFYSRLGVEAFGADIHEKALETLMIMKEELEEKNGVRRALSACNRQNDEFADMIKKLVSEKEELKQQLAEKEKEIENLNNRILISQLQAPEEQRLKIIGSYCCQYNPKRDKISFALEQLEKVKEFFLEQHRDEEMDTDYLITKDAGEIADYLLDQIKQLKVKEERS